MNKRTSIRQNYLNCFEQGFTDTDGKPVKPYKNKWFVKGRKCPEGVFTIREYPQFLSFHPSIWSCLYKTDFIRKHNINFQEIPGAGWADNLFQVKTLVLAEKITYTDEAYYCYRKRHLDDANDLKDINIPFKRSEEIRQWLSTQNI